MAELGMDFDATQVDPSAPREVLPAGDYVAHIIASEMKGNSLQTGSFLSLTYEILGGDHERRQFFNNLNLFNPNAKAVEIAQRDLSAICHATNQLRVNDSAQLHFKPMLVKLKVRPAGPDKNGVMRDAQNEVGGHSPVNGAGAAPRPSSTPQTARPATPAATTQAAPAGKAPPPWAKAQAA